MIDTSSALGSGKGIPVSPAAVAHVHVSGASLARSSAIPRIYFSCLVAFLILSRWFTAPAFLYYFDSANFALAIDEFNPALHQPQPPGYPLFVGLTRLVHLVLGDAQQVLLLTGLIGGIAAVLILFYLGSLMFGRPAGILASALLASDPVFWFGGVTNQVRIYLALGMAAVCLFAWKALSAPDRPALLYTLFATLGIAAGFRPVETWLLLPLCLWVWWRTGHSFSRLARACAALAAATLPWLSFTVWRVGGPSAFFRILNDYAQSQFQGSSALFGAQTNAASAMLLKAAAWTFLGAVVWVWAIPFVSRRRFQDLRTRAIFLAIAFFPPFIFAAVVHVGDPDQTLAGVTVLSLVGGAVLGSLFTVEKPARIYLAAALLTFAHASDFYHPRFHLAEAASYGSVRTVDRMTSDAIRAIQDLRRDGSMTLVHYQSPVTFRQISYYFPGIYLNVLPGAPGESSFLFLNHQDQPLPPHAAGLIARGSKRLVCLAARDLPESALPGWRREGPVYVLENIPEKGVKIGDYQLIWQ